VPTREQVLNHLDEGCSYAEAADRLGITAGLAYLIATGIPADGSDSLTEAQLSRPHTMPGTSQHLANPQPAANPVQHPLVLDWIRQRAHGDRQMQQAAAARRKAGAQ
jgi:hypothetical protein